MSKKYLPSVKRIAKVLEDSRGYVKFAAEKLGIAVSTLYKIIENNPELKDVITIARESKLDITEYKLEQHIHNDNLTAIMFYLRTIGRSRGYSYSDKIDLTVDNLNSGTVTFNIGDIPVSHEAKALSVELLRALQKDIKGSNNGSGQ